MEDSEKHLVNPVRPMFTMRPGIPKMWVCNAKKGLRIFDKERYRIGRPVSVGSITTKELIAMDYVGVWFTPKGWAMYKKIHESR